MSELMEQFQSQVSDDLAKKAQEAGLLDGGHYEFIVHSWEPKESREFFDKEETKRNPFYGKPVAHLRLSLLGRREKEKGAYESYGDKARTHFIDVCPVLVNRGDDETKLELASKLFGDMQNVMKAAGGNPTSIASVIEWFKENRGVISIGKYDAGVSKSTGKEYAAGNRVYGIKPVPKVA